MYVHAKTTDNRLTLVAHPGLSTPGDNTRLSRGGRACAAALPAAPGFSLQDDTLVMPAFRV